MVSIKEMKSCENKNINLYFTDGEVWKNRKCLFFEEGLVEEDEESALIFKAGEHSSYEIYQSQIEKIEILD